MKQQAICELCMQAFEKRSANQKYCTECGVEMRKQQHREIIKNSKLRKTAARNYNKKVIAIVQKWSDEHPQKTYLSEFLKNYPNTLLNDAGLPKDVCLYNLGLTDCKKDRNCVDCWNQPIEESESK